MQRRMFCKRATEAGGKKVLWSKASFREDESALMCCIGGEVWWRRAGAQLCEMGWRK